MSTSESPLPADDVSPPLARAGQGTAACRRRANIRPGAARQRKLHVGHFAFMRSVVQGLDPKESWERYFRVEGEASDQRTVRSTIAWIHGDRGRERWLPMWRPFEGPLSACRVLRGPR